MTSGNQTATMYVNAVWYIYTIKQGVTHEVARALSVILVFRSSQHEIVTKYEVSKEETDKEIEVLSMKGYD